MLVLMSHSLCRAVFHVVFSTKERRNLLSHSTIDRTWAYIAGIGRNHDLHVYAIGGTQNHIHAVIELRPDVALSDAVRTLKSNSCRWLRESAPAFCWQVGYGAFSVSPSQVARVVNYIHNQEKHHRRMSFEDEMDSMLRAVAMHPCPRVWSGTAPGGARGI
ncbi:MAG: IS200/IS605 family transposase [Candidatus Korobacteraceae bacterium]